MTTEPTWRDVLLKAASDIEQEGIWCQKNLYDMRGVENTDSRESMLGEVVRKGVSRCAVGAIEVAAFMLAPTDWEDVEAEAIEALQSAVTEEAGRNNGYLWSIPGWNDQAGRTADEVAEMMRRAATMEPEPFSP